MLTSICQICLVMPAPPQFPDVVMAMAALLMLVVCICITQAIMVVVIITLVVGVAIVIVHGLSATARIKSAQLTAGSQCQRLCRQRLTLGAVMPLFPLRSVVVIIIVISFLSLPLLALSPSPCWHGNIVIVVWPLCPIVCVSSDSWSSSLSFCRGCCHPWWWLLSSPCWHEIIVVVTLGCHGIGHVLCRCLGYVCPAVHQVPLCLVVIVLAWMAGRPSDHGGGCAIGGAAGSLQTK